MENNKVIAINSAEAIIEPFFDKLISGLNEWIVERMVHNKQAYDWWNDLSDSIYTMNEKDTIKTTKANGLLLNAIWCNVSFEWQRRIKNEPALKMHRFFDINCEEYDDIVLSCQLPTQSVLTFRCETNQGNIEKTYHLATGTKEEYELNLEGAKKISKIEIEINTNKEGQGYGSFTWIGLQNKLRLESHLKQFEGYDENWYPYLKPVDYEAKISPRYGFLFNKKELKHLQEKHDKLQQQIGETPFVKYAKQAQATEAEKMIGEYIKLYNGIRYTSDKRYSRVRDYNQELIQKGYDIAIAAALTRDSKLLRVAARYAMSIAFCSFYEEGPMSTTKGSNFEHKAFVQTRVAKEMVIILDIAWDWFTEAGRQYILRRVNEECLGKLNARILKYSEKPECIFEMNQLLLFSEGRLLGYLALENHYKRAKDFTEIVYRDILESVEMSIQPDGSYLEGPAYFSFLGEKVPQYISYYTRQRELNYHEAIPAILKKTEDFAQVVASTDDNKIMISICDAKEKSYTTEYMVMMASCIKESHWVNLFKKAYQLKDGVPDNIFVLKLMDQIGKEKELAPYIWLKDMNLVASHRKYKDEWLKILLIGNKANAGHNHEDKGSFVIEFAGDTYAMEAGISTYDQEFAAVLKCCQRHNMLLPYGTQERPAQQNPLLHDIVPASSGDNKTFNATIDLTPGWQNYYEKWERTIQSETPNHIQICDEYELLQGEGVDFLWMTQLEVRVNQQQIILYGKRSKMILDLPSDVSIRLHEIELPDEEKATQIVLRKESKQGMINVDITVDTIE